LTVNGPRFGPGLFRAPVVGEQQSPPVQLELLLEQLRLGRNIPRRDGDMFIFGEPVILREQTSLADALGEPREAPRLALEASPTTAAVLA
jgi:hypothetical protein